MSRTKWILLVIVLLFAVIQFYRPAMTNPAVDPARTIQATAQVPPQVDSILRRSCYDCHSNETRYLWYAKVAPASWLLAHDIDDGRAEVNFSNWAALDKGRAARKLKKIAEEVQSGDMPQWYYLPLHPAAKLSDADRQLLVNWAHGEQARIGAATPGERTPLVNRGKSAKTTATDEMPVIRSGFGRLIGPRGYEVARLRGYEVAPFLRRNS